MSQSVQKNKNLKHPTKDAKPTKHYLTVYSDRVIYINHYTSVFLQNYKSILERASYNAYIILCNN